MNPLAQRSIRIGLAAVLLARGPVWAGPPDESKCQNLVRDRLCRPRGEHLGPRRGESIRRAGRVIAHEIGHLLLGTVATGGKG